MYVCQVHHACCLKFGTNSRGGGESNHGNSDVVRQRQRAAVQYLKIGGKARINNGQIDNLMPRMVFAHHVGHYQIVLP